MSSGCSCVVATRVIATRSNGSRLSSMMRSQPPPSATTGPASKPKIGCSGSNADWSSDAVAWMCRSSSPQTPGKSKTGLKSPSSALTM